MSKPNLIVLAHSERWCSAISRNFPMCRQSWVLNAAELDNESLEFQGSAGIVEVPPSPADEFFLELFELANNSVQLKLFAVGDAGLLKWRSLLRAAGVATWHWSMLQIPSLVRAIGRHHDSVRYVSQPIEKSVWSDLPWPTAATDRQA